MKLEKKYFIKLNHWQFDANGMSASNSSAAEIGTDLVKLNLELGLQFLRSHDLMGTESIRTCVDSYIGLFERILVNSY